MARRSIEILCIYIFNGKPADFLGFPAGAAPVVRTAGYEQAVLLCNVQKVLRIRTVIAGIKRFDPLYPLRNKVLDDLCILDCFWIREHRDSAGSLDQADDLLGNEAEMRHIGRLAAAKQLIKAGADRIKIPFFDKNARYM